MTIWGAIAGGLVKRGGACLISISDARGSTPREAGTRMVVFADGTFTGTIGGGTLEWRAIAEAQRLLGSHVTIVQAPGADLTTACSTRSYALGPELGQCCGGRMTLRFEVIDPHAIAAVKVLASHEADGEVRTAATVHGGLLHRRIVASHEAVPALAHLETFGENRRTLVLFGAGHVGRALVLALNPLPFRVIWVDARPDAFPAAVPANVTLIRPADPVAVIGDIAPGGFVLIMTHSHELDLALCHAALGAEQFPYVGVIGSSTKRARFERRLIEAGIARASVDRLVCPIGAMGPKSKLPAAIAAATAVELLVKDELCLKVASEQVVGKTTMDTAFGGATRGQSSGS